MELWESFKIWFMSLGENYGVNPIIFGSLYVGTIPLFTFTLGWVIKNSRAKKPILLPLLLTGLFFISAYIYLIIAGKNIPYWVYAFIVLMIVVGLIGTLRKIRQAN